MEFSFSSSASKIAHSTAFTSLESGDVLMIGVACLLVYLAIWKKFEPLLLTPYGLRLPSCKHPNEHDGKHGLRGPTKLFLPGHQTRSFTTHYIYGSGGFD